MCIINKNNNKNKKRKCNSYSNKSKRSKTRKPKYLSLSKHMIVKDKPLVESSSEMTEMTPQLNLFPLHPENYDENYADRIFNSDDRSFAGEHSLTGILGRPSPELAGSPASYDRSTFSESDLVRTAMKRRSISNNNGGPDNNDDEEKWVCYSEVVEEVTSKKKKKKKKKRKNQTKKKRVETTLSSSEGNSVICDKSSCSSSCNSSATRKSLELKLDYEGILNAWSDKGSLYIKSQQSSNNSHSHSHQTVPDLLHYDHHYGLMDGWGSSAGNLWKVPENDDIKVKEEIDGWKLGQREASVLRYKEKRQSRLFAKRIRYEVRKLNAEKRPRMKGRFVKIS